MVGADLRAALVATATCLVSFNGGRSWEGHTLLARSFASGGLARGLLGTGHCDGLGVGGWCEDEVMLVFGE